MSLVMYDSVDVGQIPVDAQAAAGYVGGHWPTYAELCRRLPHAHVLSIAVTAEEDADCLDVETGDATPQQAPAWVRRQLHRGVWRPALYANLSTMPAVVHELAQAGLNRDQVRLWVAHYTGEPHIPTGYDACQWTDRALGRNLDESLLADAFFPAPKAKRKPRRRRRAALHPKVAGGTTAAALGVALTAILRHAGVHVDAQLGAAISTLAAALGGWLTPSSP